MIRLLMQMMLVFKWTLLWRATRCWFNAKVICAILSLVIHQRLSSPSFSTFTPLPIWSHIPRSQPSHFWIVCCFLRSPIFLTTFSNGQCPAKLQKKVKKNVETIDQCNFSSSFSLSFVLSTNINHIYDKYTHAKSVWCGRLIWKPTKKPKTME